MAVPDYARYAAIIDQASKRFGVDPRLIRGAMALENYGGDPTLPGSAGEIGLMQVRAPTYAALAKQHGLGPDRAAPENNIMAGTAYLREGLDAGRGDWGKALAYYNAGPGGAGTFLKTGDFSSLPAVTQAHLTRGARLGLLDPAQAPPAEVAAPKPTQPVVQESLAMPQTTPAPSQFYDPNSSAPVAESGSGSWGLLGDGDWKMALVAGLMSLGDGIRGGTGAAGTNMLMAQQQAAERKAERKDDRWYKDAALQIQLMNALRKENPVHVVGKNLVDSAGKVIYAAENGKGGLFDGNSVEGQALNHLVTRGILTPEQALTWAASKPLTGPNGQADIATPMSLASAGASMPPSQGGASTPAPTGVQTIRGAQAKPIPDSMNQAMLGNMAALRNVDDALAALGKTPDAVGSDINLIAKLPFDAVNRYDPQGTDARAKISKVAGEKVHDLSGAAVSPTEFARLKPFVPEMGDSPATAKTKLQNFRGELHSILRDQARTYGPEAGFQPNPVLTEFFKGTAAQPKSGAPAELHYDPSTGKWSR